MTTETYPGPSEYTIAGRGPYAVGHEFTAGAIRPYVQQMSGADWVALDPADFDVTPEAGENGDVILSASAEAAYTGYRLQLRRETVIEQGWIGQGGAREEGLEAQQDRTIQVAQEQAEQLGRALLVPVDASDGTGVPVVLEPGRVLLAGPNGKSVVAGADASEIANASANAAAAQAAAAAALVARLAAEAAEAGITQLVPRDVDAFVADGVTNTLTIPGVYTSERLIFLHVAGTYQGTGSFTLSNDGINTTLTSDTVWPAGNLVECRAWYQVATPVADPAAIILPNGQSVIDAHSPGYATRAAAVIDVGNGNLDHLPEGARLVAAGRAYQKQAGATGIPDMPGYVPEGVKVSPHHFATLAPGDDALAAFNAAKAYLDSIGGGVIEDRSGSFHISAPFSLGGTVDVRLLNTTIKPHPTWVSVHPGLGNCIFGSVAPVATAYQNNPLVLIPAGGGNKTVEDCFLDGRDAALNPVADGVLWMAGGNKVRRNTIRGFANFGIWIDSGTDGFCTENKVFQWLFADANNGIAAQRTGAGIAIGTGDIAVRNNTSHGTRWPLYVHGTGACTYSGNHWYNGASSGDVTTAGKTYSALVTEGARPVFNADYFDNGIVRLETPQVQIQGCRLLVGDAINDGHFIEFAPQNTNEPLNGLMIHGCDFQGSKGGAALVATADPTTCDFFRIDTTNGTLSGSEDNVIVENNTYHFGTTRGAMVPSTSGCVRWIISGAVGAGGWALDGTEYRTYDSRDFYSAAYPFLFFAGAVEYNFTVSIESNAAAKPYSTPDATQLRKLNATTIQLRCNSANSIKAHCSWDGRNNKFI